MYLDHKSGEAGALWGERRSACLGAGLSQVPCGQVEEGV